MKRIWSRAFELLTLRLLSMQLGLAIATAVLFLVWLRVPDANVFEVLLSAVLGLMILAIAMSGESAILLRIRSLPVTRKRILRDALMLTVAALLWLAWTALIEKLSVHDVLRAGYLNSRFPHAWRNFFSYPHFLLWFQWLWSGLSWLGIGLLVALAIASIQTERFVRAGVRTFFSASYWIVLLTVAIFTRLITNALLSWTPGRGISAEMVSLVLRLSIIGIIDLVLGCYLLTTASAVIERYVEAHETPAGTPDASQPRTAENP